MAQIVSGDAGDPQECRHLLYAQRKGQLVCISELQADRLKRALEKTGSVSSVINGKMPTVCGYYVRRKEDVGDAESITIDGIYRTKNNKVAMLDESGNTEQMFESLREAAKFIGGDHKALKNAAIKGRVYHDKKWRLL